MATDCIHDLVSSDEELPIEPNTSNDEIQIKPLPEPSTLQLKRKREEEETADNVEEVAFFRTQVVKAKKFLKEKGIDQETKRPSQKRIIQSPKKMKVKLTQMHFKPVLEQRQIICPECQMSYVAHIPDDKEMHKSHHATVTRGISTSLKFKKVIQDSIPITVDSKQSNYKIVEIDISSPREVSLAVEFMKIVNKSLNAPEETSEWKTGKGKVFMVICSGRAVGLVSTEECKTGHWMIHETGNLVENRPIKVSIGISRIYTSQAMRRKGLGLKMLNTVMNHSFYGVSLNKYQIAWSQPSEFGGKLALKFNSVKHKSGKLLIPVYIEGEDD